MTYALHYVISLKNMVLHDYECLSVVAPTCEHCTLCSTFLPMICWCRNSLFPFSPRSIQLRFGYRFWHRNRRNAESEMFAELLILYIGKLSPDNVHDLFCFSTEGLYSWFKYQSVKTHLLFYHYSYLPQTRLLSGSACSALLQVFNAHT